jgi:ATP-binding cassette, subfamily B, bacterial
LAKLLTRLTKITGGELLINDVNVDAYDPLVLRSHISVLFQDVGEFSGLTISENIGIGNPERIESSEAIHQSATDAGAAEFIEQLPHQYNSYLGHIPGWYRHTEGVDKWDSDSDSDSEDDEEKKADEKKVQKDLSGGQWQKLGLARAFMRGNEADLMVLDEPTANLDPEAEHKLFETIKKSRRQRTTVFISHRFNTVRVADRIMVMEKGEVKEFGTHEELMMLQDGKYRQLYNIQAKGFVVNEEGEVSEEVDGVVLNLKIDV